jgi:hypothetical protein
VLLVLGSSEPTGVQRHPEAAVWKLVPLVSTSSDLREAYDRLYPLHLPNGRGSYTEVDVRSRHEGGSSRSIGCLAT